MIGIFTVFDVRETKLSVFLTVLLALMGGSVLRAADQPGYGYILDTISSSWKKFLTEATIKLQQLSFLKTRATIQNGIEAQYGEQQPDGKLRHFIFLSENQGTWSRQFRTTKHEHLDFGQSILGRNSNFFLTTNLHEAAQYGLVGPVRRIISEGFDVNEKDCFGDLAIDLALKSYRIFGDLDSTEHDLSDFKVLKEDFAEVVVLLAGRADDASPIFRNDQWGIAYKFVQEKRWPTFREVWQSPTVNFVTAAVALVAGVIITHKLANSGQEESEDNVSQETEQLHESKKKSGMRGYA